MHENEAVSGSFCWVVSTLRIVILCPLSNLLESANMTVLLGQLTVLKLLPEYHFWKSQNHISTPGYRVRQTQIKTNPNKTHFHAVSSLNFYH